MERSVIRDSRLWLPVFRYAPYGLRPRGLARPLTSHTLLVSPHQSAIIKTGSEETAMDQIRVCTHAGPGSEPVIRSVPWPKVGKKAALIKVGACGVCGPALHTRKGLWRRPLPGPSTLGHELGEIIVEGGDESPEDFRSKPLKVG